MSAECDFCGRHAASAGELRAISDPDQGGAIVAICSDCHSDGLPIEADLLWDALPAIEDHEAYEAAIREMAEDDRAHAERERRAGL